jgi:nickel-dependent lactate racemase
MTIDIPIGPDRTVRLEIPDKNLAAVVQPREIAAVRQESILRRALNEPVDMPGLNRFLGRGGKALVIVNDASRPTPTARILDMLADQAGDLSPFDFLVATGVHRSPGPGELITIFGPRIKDMRGRIFIHDGNRGEGTVKIGVTRRGTEVILNARAVKARKIICVSSVEPHYFAGYTGGRKSFLPGIASRRSIEQNHRYALDPRARLLVLRGNPVHEDMTESLKFLADKEIFSIQIVLDRDRRISYCAAGHVLRSFSRAVGEARKIYCRPIAERADIVVTIARYPMDIDLYQSQKAIENGKLALKKDGILILVSQCRNGIGDRAFYDRLRRFKDPAACLKDSRESYRLGFHKSVKLAELMIWADVWAVTGLPDSDLGAIFIRPFSELPKALEAALRKKGPKAKVLVLMDGSVTVPILKNKLI